MKKSIFILIFFPILATNAYAEWFYRGTTNGWDATQMEQISTTTYRLCQNFNNGDADGDPRFKIDRNGDWSESYPANDHSVNSNTSYQINFDASNNSITTNVVSSCSTTPVFLQNFGSLFFRGTPNGWAIDEMALVADNTWQVTINFDGQANQRFKFDVSANWSENFGDNNNDGVLELSGADILTDVVGEYIIQVNDSSLAYNIAPNNATQNQLPIAAISPADNQTVTIGDSIQLSAINSSDPDGSIVSYLWSTGESTQNINFTFNTLGQEPISLTVTDNNGATAQTSINITVIDILPPTDNWFFRGTPNAWGAAEMNTSDNINYCLHQSFNNGDGSGGPRFKIDHFADWSENYPAQDFIVDANSSYDICFNKNDKNITANKVPGADIQAPSVSASTPAGNYTTSQLITLSVSDNEDPSPRIFYTIDGSTPTTGSPLYDGEIFTANDVNNGVDLVINTLALDASNNQAEQSFSYTIGENTNSGDFREETIYFLMVARFYDGDESNNYYNRDRIKQGDPQWRGDFKGLIQQLDYIQDLGFAAIWITPPVENRSGLDYHGYHAYDWTTIDPRLESVGATYKDFIDAAHAKDIKVIQDVVINHSSQYGIRNKVWIDHLPIKYYVPPGSQQGEMSNDPYFGNLGDYKSTNRDDNDNTAAPQWFIDRHNSDPDGTVPLVDPKTGQTVPLAGYDANRFFGIDSQALDGNWYHLNGFMAGGDWENPISLQNKHMAGDTIDLATGNQNVKDYINNAVHRYLDMGVDAIRLDTAKHVERNELLTYTQNWQAHKPGLFVFGEVLVFGLGFGSELVNDNAPAEIRPWWYTRTGSDPRNPQGNSNFSVIDFPLFSTFRDNVTKGSLSGIKGALDMDWTYSDPTQLVTFFQNHDVGPDNDFKFRFCCEEANAALVYNLLWTIRGIPTLYSGEEIMFMAGAPQDIQSANDTIDGTGRAYYGAKLDDLATTQNHSLYQHIKRLNQIRSNIPALQKGPMSFVNEWGSGMSFVRQFESSYVVVGLATGSNQNISMSDIINGTYRDAITGNTITVNNGSINFTVAAFSAGIYVLDGPGKIGNDGVYLK